MYKHGWLIALTLGLAGLTARADDCPAKKGCLSWFAKKDCVKKECVRVPDTKKKTHTEYRCIVEDLCKPGCHFCKKGCDDCKSCGKVRTRRKLVKRIVTEEECGSKCIAVIKETCPPPAPAVESIPAPTGK